MAIRTKTIEYAFPLDTTSVTTGVSRALAQIAALVISETTSRTFRSVILEVFLTESGTVAASLTAILLGIQLGAVAFSDATVTQTIANSGENQSFLFTRDVTSYFVTNYTGTTMTCNARVTATGVTTINCSAKLIIKYEYDDAATTQIKTVKIPIDGNIGNLTTAFTTVVVYALFNVFNTRAVTGFLARGAFRNRKLLVAIAASFGLHLTVLWYPPLAGAFGVVPLTGTDWVEILAVTLPIFIVGIIFSRTHPHVRATRNAL
jgi:hypothetical protein